jgi:hypothetical protein
VRGPLRGLFLISEGFEQRALRSAALVTRHAEAMTGAGNKEGDRRAESAFELAHISCVRTRISALERVAGCSSIRVSKMPEVSALLLAFLGCPSRSTLHTVLYTR